ncbi:MAG: hypothetical protein ACJASN_000784, partial [Cyclobacteriaceae bacterium]
RPNKTTLRQTEKRRDPMVLLAKAVLKKVRMHNQKRQRMAIIWCIRI